MLKKFNFIFRHKGILNFYLQFNTSRVKFDRSGVESKRVQSSGTTQLFNRLYIITNFFNDIHIKGSSSIFVFFGKNGEKA